MRNVILAGVLGAVMLSSSAAYAAKQERNVSAKRHPNIAAAQRLANQAFQKVVAAQKANEYDMEGHAQKAKELLEQASAELKEAAETANKNAK